MREFNPMTADTYQSWLASLKVGDRVIVDGNFRDKHIGCVERMTATQFIVGGNRYRKSDGMGMSRGYCGRWSLRKLTDEEELVITQKKLAYQLEKMHFDHLPLPTLQAIHKLIQESQSQQGKDANDEADD